jgi:class 3 adenylate cyclase
MAGVVGKRKFTYDVWGDTVNVAARLESASEAGRVNVSATVYAQVKAYFDLAARGPIEIKNKSPVEMFFLDRLRPEFAADALGETPNEALLVQRRALAATVSLAPGAIV